MSSLAEVEVLLATYNGERFLREQIDSLLNQDYTNLRVLARDDGSDDGTPAILSEYAQRFPNRFRVMPPSAPTGSAKKNFLLLMKASTADYICFSDQDDLWLPAKVSLTKQAMDQLESQWGRDVPLLVFTDLRVVDDKLNTLHESFWVHMAIDPDRIHQFSRLLVRAVVTGCTAMVNRPLLILSLRMPEGACMHDWWVSLLASVLGKSSAIKDQTVLYRQHDRNVVGVGVKESRRLLLQRIGQSPDRATPHREDWQVSQRQAESLLEVHGNALPVKERAVLRAFLRCDTSRSRFVRVATFFLYGFYSEERLLKLAMVLHLWRMKASERQAY